MSVALCCCRSLMFSRRNACHQNLVVQLEALDDGTEVLTKKVTIIGRVRIIIAEEHELFALVRSGVTLVSQEQPPWT